MGEIVIFVSSHMVERGALEREKAESTRGSILLLWPGLDSERWAGLTEPHGDSMVTAPGSGRENQIISLKGCG